MNSQHHSYGHDCECPACAYLNRILPQYRPPAQGPDFALLFMRRPADP